MRGQSVAVLLVSAVCALALSADAQTSQSAARRPLRVGDLYRLRDVRDPQLSPDGAWVAYSVTAIDSAKDKSDSDVWMTSWDGTQTIRLTSSPESESSPRWSPDGRYLAFLSGRQEGKGAQLWLLDRRGGEAQRASQVRGGISDYAWSPDAKRIVLVVEEETDTIAAKDTGEKKTPKPIVIDRYTFKRDIVGYLGTKRSSLSLVDVATKKTEFLTRGLTDDDEPAWSPDGSRIVFVRRRVPEPRDIENSDVYVIDVRADATPRRLTDFPGPDGGRPTWSPDGKRIAFLRGDDPRFSAYHQNKLAVVPSDGGTARVLAASLDRPVLAPRFAADGASIFVLVVDDREQQLARVRVADGAIERVVSGKRVVAGHSTTGARTAVVTSTPDRAFEIFAAEGGALRKLTSQNDSLFAELQLGTTDGLESRSKDGTEVHGIIVRPAGSRPGVRLPLILYIHGGPNGQDAFQFSFDRELFAAHGYAVLAPNYRGSNGRGSAFQKAIYADWGNKEVVDLLGAVDQAVAAGIADPERLAIGGWSYGGILTDYTIATTPRFKAAASGAGSALQLSMYGVDQYTPQYDMELGYPWTAEGQERWMKVSYPFFKADRVKTPTLFMVGERDFNVPAVGSEQMYQALRTLGVPTQLVIYPNQFHGITTPSYRVDRLQRYLMWWDRYLKPGSTPAVGQ
jgi:dipeptidyl aminopeptidase/acylaminoacyl peptidase